MSEQPSYYSIITANVRYDNRLTDSEKLLFAEITSLSNKYGYCTASNNYFAKLYQVTKRTISARINNLKKYEYLKIEFDFKGNEVKKRRMYPMTQTSTPIEKDFHTPVEEKFYTPIEANFQENNTSNNNTRVNITSINNNSATDVTRERFEEWWELYDKKKDKKLSYPKFKKCLKDHTFEQIMSGTRKYVSSIKDKQYQKDPKTFLNNQSYMNEYVEGDAIAEDNPYANAFDNAKQVDMNNLPF